MNYINLSLGTIGRVTTTGTAAAEFEVWDQVWESMLEDNESEFSGLWIDRDR